MSEQSSTTMGLILMSLCWFSCRLPVVRLVWDCRDVPPWLERLRASTRVWIQLLLPLPGGPATITPVTTSKTTHEHAKIILAKLGCKNYFGKVGGGLAINATIKGQDLKKLNVRICYSQSGDYCTGILQVCDTLYQMHKTSLKLCKKFHYDCIFSLYYSRNS